jgi:hypothetical protein
LPHARAVDREPKSAAPPSPSRLTRGAFRESSRTYVRDAVDADGAQDERAESRTAKSCGSDTPTLVSSWRRCLRIVACDGGKKARSQRRARRKPLKPFAQGMSECFGGPVVTTLVCFLFLHTRLRVRMTRPAFPVPSSSRAILGKTRARHAAGTKNRVIARRRTEISVCHHRACPGDPDDASASSTVSGWPGHAPAKTTGTDRVPGSRLSAEFTPGSIRLRPG